MSLATRIESLVIRVAQEFNDVRATAGSLASLSTNDKSSLVAAINELKAAVLSAMAIDDNQIATSTTYSSNKIVSLLDALKADILGGADAAYDTLVEIQQLLQNGTTGLDALLAAVNLRVRFDAAGGVHLRRSPTATPSVCASPATKSRKNSPSFMPPKSADSSLCHWRSHGTRSWRPARSGTRRSFVQPSSVFRRW